MYSFIKKISIGVVVALMVISGSVALAASNIDGASKHSQFLDIDLDSNSRNDLISWLPVSSGKGATVTDAAITGYIWGETVGWINLGPFTNAGPSAGVKNTCNGILSGYAWGQNTGWINFSPSQATIAPNINTSTGAITGQVWSQNYGWIELASTEAGFTGLTTTWRPSSACSTGGGGGGATGSYIYRCKDVNALNYDSNPLATAQNSLCTYPNPNPNPGPGPNPDPNPNPNTNPGSGPDTNPGGDPTVPPPGNPSGSPISIIPTIQLGSAHSGIPGWIPLTVALLGIAGSLPSLFIRAANNLMTFVWGRKKLRGIIYDSKTKEPLDPVYVTVVDLATNQEVKTQQTDMQGRFGFVLPKGHYKITAGKTNYLFPSAYLAGRVSDEAYDHLYFGEPFTVEDEQRVVTMNIPMDPQGTDWNQQEKKRTGFLNYFIKGQTRFVWVFNILFVLGFLASIMITYFYPSWWNYGITGVYVILGLIQVYGYGPIYAGMVTKDGVPLAGALVTIWSATIHHEIAKKVTGASGAYYALVPKADYYVTIDQKNPDGTFTKVYTSEVFHANHGCIDRNFKL